MDEAVVDSVGDTGEDEEGDDAAEEGDEADGDGDSEDVHAVSTAAASATDTSRRVHLT